MFLFLCCAQRYLSCCHVPWWIAPFLSQAAILASSRLTEFDVYRQKPVWSVDELWSVSFIPALFCTAECYWHSVPTILVLSLVRCLINPLAEMQDCRVNKTVLISFDIYFPTDLYNLMYNYFTSKVRPSAGCSKSYISIDMVSLGIKKESFYLTFKTSSFHWGQSLIKI